MEDEGRTGAMGRLRFRNDPATAKDLSMKRRGTSLVEMVMVITVAAALAGIAVSLLLALVRTQERAKARAEQQMTLVQLADQFRRDVHAARRWVGPKPRQPADWLLEVNHKEGEAVRYFVADGAMVREELIMGAVQRRDSYGLPEDFAAEMTFDGQKPMAEVHLTVAPREASLRRGHEIQIDAVLGRDHRFAKQEKRST
jgi:type II secretory pathway pseudopilin PulG